MRGIFSFLVHPFWCSQSRLQFIGAGVAFLVTPGDEQPLRPLWRSLNRMTGHALASDNPIENSVDTVISEGRLLSWYTWISTIDLLNWLFLSLFRSEVSHSCHGPIPGLHTSFKYRYKSFKRAFNKFKDPIQELSRLTYFSVWQLQVNPGQHNSLASPWHQCTWLIFYELLSQFYSGICLRCPSALGESVGTLSGWWDEP